MTQTILVAGTASHVGKSTVTAGLCRLLEREGISVSPFKAQNMSNNAQVALTPGDEWGEIGISQYAQAQAARVVPTTDMNPVLLKPRGDGESQLIIHGEAVDTIGASGYYDTHWVKARRAAIDSYDRLRETHDVIVAEGAGSIAEINLHHRDLANVETARFTEASILLLADIERGGAFASLYGTLELMPADLRSCVKGALLTKFRGNRKILEPGIEEFEERAGIPIIGVIPYEDTDLPEEDSVSLLSDAESKVVGSDDGVDDRHSITVAIPRLPRISNFTDFEPLAREPGVRVKYVPLGSTVDDADAIILPGTKNTVDDLLALKERRFADHILDFDGPIVGICGGFQMLGERIMNADIEGTTDQNTVCALGLLPIETIFSTEKNVTRVSCEVDGVGPIAGASGIVSGYEIHMGRSKAIESVSKPLGDRSASTSRVLGTYIHGLFENENVRTTFVETVYRTAGKSRPPVVEESLDPFDRAADLVDGNVDLQGFFDDELKSDSGAHR